LQVNQKVASRLLTKLNFRDITVAENGAIAVDLVLRSFASVLPATSAAGVSGVCERLLTAAKLSAATAVTTAAMVAAAAASACPAVYSPTSVPAPPLAPEPAAAERVTEPTLKPPRRSPTTERVAPFDIIFMVRVSGLMCCADVSCCPFAVSLGFVYARV
jgi:cell division septation protein DedD